MKQPITVAKTFEPHGNMQQFRLQELTEFTCARCGNAKKSKLVTVQNKDWTSLVCNGCYGELRSKQQD